MSNFHYDLRTDRYGDWNLVRVHDDGPVDVIMTADYEDCERVLNELDYLANHIREQDGYLVAEIEAMLKKHKDGGLTQ